MTKAALPGVTLIGCGFVADLYMRSFAVTPEVRVLGAYDRNPVRRQRFCAYWGVPELESFEALRAAQPRDGVVLNLTNPGEHHAVTRDCLESGFHVWSEKPLVLDVAEAVALQKLADERGLQLASAPSSVLGETAQTLAHAFRRGVGGTPRLVYAELDDGFIPQAPVHDWISDSGAPWPYEDELRVGCTLEHAGYYLSWMIGAFGAATRVVTATAEIVPDKFGVKDAAPDFSVATVYFERGPVLRLTCSISAPHDHRLRVVGDEGVLEVPRAWDNDAPVRYRKRLRIRRRLLESPIPQRIRLKGPTHSKVSRKGAAAMNFALGPLEQLEAIAAGRASRLSGDYAVHLTEVTLACQRTGTHEMTTRCEPMEPMPWAR